MVLININAGNNLFLHIGDKASSICNDCRVHSDILCSPIRLKHETLPDVYKRQVLMNVLENAVEGCGRLADPGERWLFFRLCLAGGSLTLECRNSAPPGTEDRTSKRDRRAHGFGLSILRGIAQRYDGELSAGRREDAYETRCV